VLVGIWNRTLENARPIAQRFNIPAYDDLDKLVRETGAEIGIVSVSSRMNGQAGLMAIESGLNVLLETPIAPKLSEADTIIRAARERNLKIEIAEQFHRRPMEQIKLRIIESGVLGRVYTSFNDYAGHGYHGVSVMRSYLGFDARPVQVTGVVRQFDLAPYASRADQEVVSRKETQEHGIVEFQDGRIGIIHWSNVGYESSVRWWRSGRFLAEKGMGVSVRRGKTHEEWISLLTPDGKGYQMMNIERRCQRLDGGMLVAIEAFTGDPDQPVIRWDNPLVPPEKGAGPLWDDDELGVAGCIMSLVDAVREGKEPTYGPAQGRLDQEVILALRHSSRQGGRPLSLPLAPDIEALW
ncbi:Gfo/Idh/MocA family oxidoreductase, partial [bacterium]|nr:Gfo/Idh/MocA family oxidoreductase [bacterium]